MKSRFRPHRRLLQSIAAALLLTAGMADAQRPPAMPPAFAGGIPGLLHSQALVVQRHQARTLLYRQAIEELRRNPQVAEVPDCPPTASRQRLLCIRRPRTADPAPPPAAAPQPNADRPAASADGAPARNRRRLALLVGNTAYAAPIPALATPVADIEAVAELLRESFGYRTRLLRNAGKSDIVEALNRLADDAGPDDSVLLFYAGHGYLLDDTGMGYWIPIDASSQSAANWIANNDIARSLRAIPARQILLISDSCFSGALTREHKLGKGAEPAAIFDKRAVLALSSGDEEPVSDEGKDGHSIFAWHLLKAFQALDGGNKATGGQIHRRVREAVRADYPQEPQYGGLLSAGHVAGGEYLLDPPGE